MFIICLQAVYQLSGPVCKSTAFLILLLTFILRFVIDFLSIRKVIIFSAIATADRHLLRSSSIHQNAANCKTIHFRYIAQLGGLGGTENLLRTFTYSFVYPGSYTHAVRASFQGGIRPGIHRLTHALDFHRNL